MAQIHHTILLMNPAIQLGIVNFCTLVNLRACLNNHYIAQFCNLSTKNSHVAPTCFIMLDSSWPLYTVQDWNLSHCWSNPSNMSHFWDVLERHRYADSRFTTALTTYTKPSHNQHVQKDFKYNTHKDVTLVNQHSSLLLLILRQTPASLEILLYNLAIKTNVSTNMIKYCHFC